MNMLQNQETYNLRQALDEALRSNDDLAREVQKLETETYADQICGSWRLSENQTVHIRKTGSDCYGLSVWTRGIRSHALSLYRVCGSLRVILADDSVGGGVYYFPENDSLLIEGVGLCTSIEKSDA